MTVYNVVSRTVHVYLGLILCCICIISSIGSIIFSKNYFSLRPIENWFYIYRQPRYIDFIL
jgi:TRAP-type C4-dicarboxylate transport system permease small subunit